ncbi:MAG: chromosome segregation protein SMC [Alphaproteobacteria bacterium]|nr:chromosome segregation protein SMC [Alphaproteobacteria bacterium]
MVQFTKIRLSGFKSFIEPTELLVENGLTGIVGPNGCGKSNLLESLRWAMGETAPKKLRGGGMEDVIFGGTADRPARNIAEVQILLNNRDRTAPAAFNDSDEIEIIRRIERGAGSSYRVNGKEVRARDVQLVFADAASGARSTALVGQGRIGALINAKPTDRRGLLEEAAGITGLHSRRHEAELRLRAAENNLERLDDVITAFQGQLQSLKRQARQASRYRNLSGHIRKAEAILYHLKWQDASAELVAARTRLQDIEAKLTEQTRQVSEATTAHGEAADALATLREAESQAAANLHRLTVAREQLDSEERRIADLLRTAQNRLEQIGADEDRERSLAADANDMLARLGQERSQLEAASQGEAEARQALLEQVRLAETAVEEREAAYDELAQRIAADQARSTDIGRQRAAAEERVQRLERRAQDIVQERSTHEATAREAASRAEAEAGVREAQERFSMTRAETETAEQAREQAQAAAEQARAAHQDADTRLAKLQAESAALKELLRSEAQDDYDPIVDAVTVKSGYETALDAALGDDLVGSTEAAAPLHWRGLKPLPASQPLPDGAQPLANFVSGPAALDRRLSQVGVVADAAAGVRLQDALAPGQCLVTREGALWRWDGFVVAAGASTGAGQRLAQQNRLKALAGEIATATRAAEESREQEASARTKADAAANRHRAVRDAANRAFADLTSARDRLAELTERTAEARSRLEALAQTSETVRTELAEAKSHLATLKETEANLADPEADRPALDGLRRALGEERSALIARRKDSDGMDRETEARSRRLADIGSEADSWRRRAESAASQIAELEERRTAVKAEIARLERLPDDIAEKRNALMSYLEDAESKRKAAADRLAEAETATRQLEKALRAAEAAFADQREQRGLAEGAVRQAEQAVANIAERIAERLDCRPEDALAAGEVKEDEALPDLETVETRLARLIKERDNMGPVNLRADEEARELTTQIESLESERSDLIAAINKFRHAISELNHEGRERLTASFEEVDRHFQELFTRLFGGGRAHLSLVESDDPLEAGLEIMASPPGKRLQTLSLLSGGEQALTALALLFAVFLTNPAPICVLDEVDAPLDDANVDRFCTLLEQIAHSSDTRFLLITHHRMTMARMDRLFGVTMPERGVSQLVSVNLQGAETLRESA